MPCQNRKMMSKQRAQMREDKNDVVKAIEKPPPMRKRMGWRVRGSSAEVQTKSCRNVMNRIRFAAPSSRRPVD
ncbi:hypothetical protein PTKIN_Ptkin17bG0152800 [Pterospermum kingtungense]